MRLATKHRAHLSEAFRWTPTEKLTPRTVALAGFAMGVPVLAGFALGKPSLGLVIGLGSMLLANEVPGQAAESSHGMGAAIVPALLAVPVALLLARLPWGDAAMIALSVAAATLVNWSRPAAGGAVRFIIFLILNLGLGAAGGTGAHRGGAALLFGLGALWRAVLRRLFGGRHAPAAAEPAPARVVTPRQRRIHFRRTMATLQGWQYPIRLGVGLTAAVLLRDLWPERHFGWVVLTIALLTPRAIEHLPVQITQRVAGTLGGVALAGAILHTASWLGAPGHVALAAAVVLLGVAAPLARAGNYALYCLLSTPVILLAMDAGTEGADGLLVDRLVATLGGAAVIFAANAGMDWWLGGRSSATTSRRHPRAGGDPG